MLEMKITVAAPDLAAAINNLALSLNGKKPHTVCNQYGENNHQIENVGTLKMSAGTASTTLAPVAVAAPAWTPGTPLSATPVQTATPIAPTVPVATPAPAATPAANATQAPTVPTSAPQYTLEMIATAGSALIDAGKMDQLMQLLGKFGVASLTELAPENYGAVAGELRALGAAI